MPLDLVSTTEEKIAVRIHPVTSSNKPAQVEAGSDHVTIVSGNATAVDATQAEKDADVAAGKSGLVGFVISEDTPGVSTWQVTADADLGPGVTSIVDGGSYTYNDPQAAALGTTADTPIAK